MKPRPSLSDAFTGRACRAFIIILFLCSFSQGLRAQVHSWTSINTGYHLPNGTNSFAATPNCIYFYNSELSMLIRSTDQGLSWDSLYVPSDSSHHEYRAMHFVNDSIGFLAGSDGSHHVSGQISVVKKTVNRGLTWQTYSSGINSPTLSHINFFDGNNGLVFGTGSGFTQRFQTHDGGVTWSYFQDSAGPNAQINLSGVFSSSFIGSHGFVSGFSGAYGRIAQSHDSGHTWSTHQLNASGGVSYLRFFNGTDGIVVVRIH